MVKKSQTPRVKVATLLLAGTLLASLGCSSKKYDLQNRPCAPWGGCLEGYACDTVSGTCVLANALCIDADHDGYGIDGATGSCLGSDCLDDAPTCATDCTTDSDEDGVVDCLDTCLDKDGDEYGEPGGAGDTCRDRDCNDDVATCARGCDTDVDEDGLSDCADTCLDKDGDLYGFPGGAGNSCLGLDCSDEAPGCISDCTTDQDGDSVPDCQDTCIDADGDGYGVAGTSGNTCLGADCDDNYASCTTDCSGGCTCTAADEVRLSVSQTGCAAMTAPATGVILARLSASSTCVNRVTGLTLDSVASSTFTDSTLQDIQLVLDSDPLGSWGAEDTVIAGPVGMTNGTMTFTGLSADVEPGAPAHLIVVADIASGATPGLYAPVLSDETAMQILDQEASVVLVDTAPAVVGIYTFGAHLCSGGPDDLGPGSIAIVSATAYRGPDTTDWASGAGNESSWEVRGSANGAQTTDCNLETGGSYLTTRDRGQQSEFLHINTGIPLGLPLGSSCPVRMRVYGSEYVNACKNELFTDFSEVYLFTYDTGTTVSADSQTVTPITAIPGPNTAIRGCATDYVDLDVTSLYAQASGTSTLQLRFIPEQGGGIDTEDDVRIRLIPEIYLTIGAP